MESFLLYPVVGFLVVEGICFACAYNNVFRRLNSMESRLSRMEAGRIRGDTIPTAIPVSVAPSAPPPPQAQVYYYPPQMSPPQQLQAQQYRGGTIGGGDDPLPITYASYYQNNR